jgi:hypothetical protein
MKNTTTASMVAMNSSGFIFSHFIFILLLKNRTLCNCTSCRRGLDCERAFAFRSGGLGTRERKRK